MTERREALESLLTHPGWQIVVEEARKDWARRKESLTDQATADTDDLRALAKLRQVKAACDAVELILNLPEQLLKQLKHQEIVEQTGEWNAGRRPIHPELVSQGRRGSL